LVGNVGCLGGRSVKDLVGNVGCLGKRIDKDWVGSIGCLGKRIDKDWVGSISNEGSSHSTIARITNMKRGENPSSVVMMPQTDCLTTMSVGSFESLTLLFAVRLSRKHVRKWYITNQNEQHNSTNWYCETGL